MNKKNGTPKSTTKLQTNNTLPEDINERISLVLNSDLSPQKRRLMAYLSKHPDAWTHQLATSCAVGYPPCRLFELNKDILPNYGLHVLCHKPDKWLTNRHGDTSYVHQWRLVKLSDKGVAA